MTIDRFVEDRRVRWARLGQLVSDARGRVQRLTADDVLELGRLYRATTSDLAIARRDFPRDMATERLNDLVAAAHALVYSESPTSGRRLRRFVFNELPATLRAQLPWTGAAFAVFIGFALATFLIGIAFPDVAQRALPEETRQQLAQRQLWTEIPEGFRPIAGPLIIVNNVRVAVVLFAGGMTAGLLTTYALAANGAMLGTIFAVVQSYGLSGGLLAFIAGHGALELSAIFLSGGAGLRLAWAILRPGDHSRRDSLKLGAAQAARVLIFVIPVLGVAGLIEGFLSPSGAPDAVKAAVGLATGALMWGYIAFAGRPKRRSERDAAPAN
ncbi:MAG TPA: stage II sporulation protein M [Candidatus Limnocylindrales bacterium]|nr:stage II sporulation protein M [Candidatus Limnocylindrales bacterium]